MNVNSEVDNLKPEKCFLLRVLRMRDSALAAIILLVGAICYLPALGQSNRWASHEARHAQIAKEMVRTGDFMVPHLAGNVYVDKPPLYHWIAAGFYIVTGRTGEFGARLPSALAAIFSAIGVFLFGKRLYDRQAGFIAALVLLGTALYAQWAVMARMDMLMTVFLVYAGYFSYLASEQKAPLLRWLQVELGCLLVAMAFMCKGFVPVAMGLLIMLTPWFCRKEKWPYVLPVAVMMLITVAAVCAWYAVITAGSGFWSGFMHFQTGGTGPKHQRSLLFYLIRLPYSLLPWSLLIPSAFAWSFGRVRRDNAARQMIPLAISIIGLILFSLPGNKRIHYILPIVPFMVLPVAYYVSKIIDSSEPVTRPTRWLSGILLVILPVVAAITVFCRPGLSTVGLSLSLTAILITVWLSATGFAGVVRNDICRAMTMLIVASLFIIGGVYQTAVSFYWKTEKDIVIASQAAEAVREKIPVGLATDRGDDIAFKVSQPVLGLLDQKDIIHFVSMPGERYIFADQNIIPFLNEHAGNRLIILREWQPSGGFPSMTLFYLNNIICNGSFFFDGQNL